MRLSLRKHLKPYKSLKELADDLKLTIPQLKRKIRMLQEEELLTLTALQEATQFDPDLETDQVFELFQKFERCLVCGSEMKEPTKRDIGWGEFVQCPSCQYSAHEMASYKTRRDAAASQLEELISQAQKTRRVLHDRKLHAQLLRQE